MDQYTLQNRKNMKLINYFANCIKNFPKIFAKREFKPLAFSTSSIIK